MRVSALRLLFVLLLAFAGAASTAAARSFEPSPRDWQAMRQVIVAQRDAMRAGNGARAISYATPGIRRQFGNGDRFMEMVRDSYAPLLNARHVEFLDGATIDDTVVQPLRLVLPDDTVLVALYALERDRGGRWRIAGCLLAPSTVIAS